MRFILEFAKFRDLVITKNSNLLSKINKTFVEDEELITIVYEKRYDKTIILKWNDTKTHSMINRIKTRTSFISTSEFNKFIKSAIKKLIPDEIGNNIDQTGRYGIYFPNNKFYLIIDIIYSNLFEDDTKIFITTLTLTSPKCYKTIIINDDYL